MQQWRFIPPSDGPGAWHMAVDAALVEAVRDGLSGPVLRFYHWTPVCVTLGKFQPADGNVQLDNCARLGFDVAKRPTGGRAILHDHEVTFSIIIKEEDLPSAGSNIMDSYRVLGAALTNGLQHLGVAAELVDYHAKSRGADAGMMTSAGNPACFAAKARCDIMVQHRKIIGCAQLRRQGVILQQNSLPLTVNYPQWNEVFYRADWQEVAASGAIELWNAAGREVAYDEVVEAICAGVAENLQVELVPSSLNIQELARAEVLHPDYQV